MTKTDLKDLLSLVLGAAMMFVIFAGTAILF